MRNECTSRWMIGAVLMAAVAGPPGAAAADITVTSGKDGGPGTLRQALAGAQPGDRILFAGDVNEVKLTTGELVVDKDLTIAGPGASRLRILRDSQAPEFGIFHVGSPNRSVDVLLSGFAITGGSGPANGYGGGIVAYGQSVHLTIRDGEVVGNQAGLGGAIAVWSAGQTTLEVSNTTIAGNSASYGGGGIYAVFARVDITASTISGNTAGYQGGGIESEGST